MKKINNYISLNEKISSLNYYIQEKLVFNKHTKEKNYDVDSLNNENRVLVSDRWDPKTHDMEEEWDYVRDTVEYIDKKLFCSGYLITKFDPLSKLDAKSLENKIYDIDEYLDRCINNVISGHDLGYEIRLVGGHMEIDCINSGSCGTYYIYGVEQTAWNHLSAWWKGDTDVNSLSFLYSEGAIIPIVEE